MLKILIVDDETVVRRGIMLGVDWGQLGCTVAGEAANGEEGLALARECFDIPLALGFGIKSPEQLKELSGLIDAAVFGSSLIRHLDAGGDSAGFMARWTK